MSARYGTTQEWLRAVLKRAQGAGPIPRYGTAEHLALAPSDPRFVAAAAIAAECWRDHTEPAEVARRVEQELGMVRDVESDEARPISTLSYVLDRAYAEDRPVPETSGEPSFAEICERRGEPIVGMLNARIGQLGGCLIEQARLEVEIAALRRYMAEHGGRLAPVDGAPVAAR